MLRYFILFTVKNSALFLFLVILKINGFYNAERDWYMKTLLPLKNIEFCLIIVIDIHLHFFMKGVKIILAKGNWSYKNTLRSLFQDGVKVFKFQ